MPDPAAATILSFLSAYGYAVVFPISIIEGPIVAVLAGVLVSLGQMDAVIVFLILMAGDIVGDAGWYLLGRYGGHPFVRRYGQRFGITEKRLASAERHFADHDWKIILLGKLHMSPVPTGLAVLVAAGMMRMPFVRYLVYNIIGTVPRLLVFESIGIVFGMSFLRMNRGLFDALSIGSLILTLALLFYPLFGKKRRSEEDI